MSFAAGLSKRVAAKRQETKDREVEGKKWLKLEDMHVESALDLFKQRCIRAAQNLQCDATVSFEVLTRDVPNFPAYNVKNGSYLVDSWGPGSAASWYYARRSVNDEFVPETAIQYAEVLEGMMPKFLEKVGRLGFTSHKREPGTWRVKVTWKRPEGSADHEPVNGASAVANGSTVPPAPPSPPPPPTEDPEDPTSPLGDEVAGPPSPPNEELVVNCSLEPSPPASDPPPPPGVECDASPNNPPAAKKARTSGSSHSPSPVRTEAGSSPVRTEVPSGSEVPTSDAEGVNK